MLKLLYNFAFRTKRRSLTVRALLFSAAARLRVRFLPGTRLYRYLGIQGEETSGEELSPGQRRDAAWVADKVRRVARRTPWESKCLVQAMVAQRLLRDYGLASTLYLGVGRDEKQAMTAHAWVRCGTFFITGGDGTGYACVARFATHPRAGGKK